jgi:hypothetical protein
VGTIRWPLRLHEEAAFHDYGNHSIQTALYNAFSSVFDVLVGITQHPLAQYFDEYMQTAQQKFETAHQRMATDADLHGLAQRFSFPVPILAGDESLIEDFLADLGVQLRKESKLALSSLRLHHIGPILFRLVILREYLHRPPDNDQDIFELVKQKRIYRIWTSHEQALAACHGEEDTSPGAPLGYTPHPSLYRLAVINDADLIIPDDEVLVAIRSPHSWMSGLALLPNGPRNPRRYTPPHLRLTTDKPRPKPRPVHKKIVHFKDQPSEASCSDGEVMGTGQGIDRVTEASLEDRRCAKKTRVRIPLGTVIENSDEVRVLRRSKRARMS